MDQEAKRNETEEPAIQGADVQPMESGGENKRKEPEPDEDMILMVGDHSVAEKDNIFEVSQIWGAEEDDPDYGYASEISKEVDLDDDDFTDDLRRLSPEKLEEGKQKELANLAKYEAKEDVWPEEAPGEIVEGKWVVNVKGSGIVRARIVAKQFRVKGVESRFAATPGFYVMRWLLSLLAADKKKC